MFQKKIAILRGGDDDHHDHSVYLGSNLLEVFFENLYPKYKPLDLYLDKESVFHLNGFPVGIKQLSDKIDLVINFTNPKYTQSLKSFAMPVLSHTSFSHSLSSNRNFLEEHMKNYNLRATRSLILPIYQEDIDKDIDLFSAKKAKEVLHKFPAPWFVHPYSPNKNYAPFLAKTLPELTYAILEGAKMGIPLLVEEFISENEAEIHSFKNLRGEDRYFLPFLKIHKHNFLDKHIFLSEEKNKIKDLLVEISEIFSHDFYFKLRIVWDKQKRFYIREINFLPDFHKDSSLHIAKELAGIKNKELVEAMMHEKNML